MFGTMTSTSKGLTKKAAFAMLFLVGGTGADDVQPAAAASTAATAADVVNAMADINPFRRTEGHEARGHGRNLHVRMDDVFCGCFRCVSLGLQAIFGKGADRFIPTPTHIDSNTNAITAQRKKASCSIYCYARPVSVESSPETFISPITPPPTNFPQAPTR